MGTFPKLDDRLVELGRLVLRRARCATGFHELPARGDRDQLSQQHARHPRMVQLALDRNWNVLCHGAEYHLAESVENVFPLRDLHLLHAVPLVLDMVSS